MESAAADGQPPPDGSGREAEPRGGRRPLLLLAVVFEGGLAVLAWPLGWALGEPALGDFAWDVRAALLGVAATAPMLALFLACVRWPRGPLAGIKRFVDEVVRPLFAPLSLLDLA